MENFETAYTALMDMVNRPLTDLGVLTAAKREINNAVRFLQRNHAFVYSERLVPIVYPSGELFVNLGTISSLLRDVCSVQQVSANGNLQGKPLKVKSYNQLQSQRMRYDQRNPVPPTDIDICIEEAYRQDMIVFIAGQALGLYPKPGSAVNLLIHCHVWESSMNSDDDTNFLIEYGFDVVLLIALRKMQLYMKDLSVAAVTKEEAADAVQTLIAWDSQVKETPNTSIQ